MTLLKMKKRVLLHQLTNTRMYNLIFNLAIVSSVLAGGKRRRDYDADKKPAPVAYSPTTTTAVYYTPTPFT
jgi:hypothetical protein